MQEFIDFYKYDDGLDIQNIYDLNNILERLNLLGSYMEQEDLKKIKYNFVVYRISKSRSRNVKDKYRRIWDIFDINTNENEIEKILDEIIDEEGNILDTASIGIADIRRQKRL